MIDPEAHSRIVEAWRTQRNARLMDEVGWLTLAGLDWLSPGRNRIGSAEGSDVVLPGGPAEAGSINVTDDGVLASGAFEHDGQPVNDLRLSSDKEGTPTLLELGHLRLCLIERGGRLAIRTWDTEAPQRREFGGIDHWPVAPEWRIVGTFEPTPGRTLGVPDVLGTIDQAPAPGDVVFEAGGATHRLQGLDGGDSGELWIIFADATNGSETYGGGRFLYTSRPEADGSVVIDFNRAYNPPCVFSPFATCPLPWAENRLSIRIEAGEMLYRPPD